MELEIKFAQEQSQEWYFKDFLFCHFDQREKSHNESNKCDFSFFEMTNKNKNE